MRAGMMATLLPISHAAKCIYVGATDDGTAELYNNDTYIYNDIDGSRAL
jgi:hypothetical protein